MFPLCKKLCGQRTDNPNEICADCNWKEMYSPLDQLEQIEN